MGVKWTVRLRWCFGFTRIDDVDEMSGSFVFRLFSFFESGKNFAALHNLAPTDLRI